MHLINANRPLVGWAERSEAHRLAARCAAQQEAGGVELGRHVGEFELRGLEIGEPGAELAALQHVAARRLARDFERYTRSAAAFMRLAMIRIMPRRLTRSA